ncbi:sensor histidine kinase [Granulicoccus phenolivorans]|uniref:sensor histidine kinase n=1 Tax=Granulicoccus phenolivorans TaxID=266854 RepID=UPI00042896B6|nr:ATP-binding protein [Granulicoccus phenolivorans]
MALTDAGTQDNAGTQERSWSAITESGLRWMFVVPPLVALIAFGETGLRESAELPLWAQLAHAGLALTTCAVLVLVLLHRESTRVNTVVAVLSLALVLIYGLAQPAYPVTWWPSHMISSIEAFLLGFSDRRVRWRIGAPTMAGFLVARLFAYAGTPASMVSGIIGGVSEIALALTVVLGFDAVRAIGRTTQTALDEQSEAYAREAHSHAVAHQTKEVERFLHDEVIHSVRAVASQRLVNEPEQLRSLAALTRERLAQQGEHTDSGDLEARLAAVSGQVGIRISVVGEVSGLPDDVAEAVALAAAEAVRNADRHSGAESVRVTITAKGAGVRVSVADSGHGFDTDRAVWGGLQHSIVERMEGVGGTATIRSGPRGTTVEIAWQPPGSETAPAQRMWLDLRAASARVALPMLLGSVVTATVTLPMVPRPLLVVGAALLSFGYGILMVLIASRRALPALYAWLVPVVALVTLIGNAWALPDGLRDSAYFWSASIVVALLVIPTVSQFPLWASWLMLVVVTAEIIVVLIARFGVLFAFQNYVGSMIAPSLLVAIVVVRMVVNQLGRRTVQALAETARSDARAHELKVRAELMSQRLSRVNRDVGPFLERVATGAADLRDPEVIAEARMHEADLRDEIRFGGGSAALREAVRRLRAAGWRVDLRLSPEDVTRTGADLVRLLGLVAQVHAGTMVVTAMPTPVAVLPEPTPEQLADVVELPEVATDVSDAFCRVELGRPVLAATASARGRHTR